MPLLPPRSTLFPYTTLFRSLIDPSYQDELDGEDYQRCLASAMDVGQYKFDLEFLLKADKRVSLDRKSTRLNSSHEWISYAVFCLKKKKSWTQRTILCY